jgi:hypothetical protein
LTYSPRLKPGGILLTDARKTGDGRNHPPVPVGTEGVKVLGGELACVARVHCTEQYTIIPLGLKPSGFRAVHPLDRSLLATQIARAECRTSGAPVWSDDPKKERSLNKWASTFASTPRRGSIRA